MDANMLRMKRRGHAGEKRKTRASIAWLPRPDEWRSYI
jgi:hypothetical protein